MTVADPDLWGHTLYGLRAIEQGLLTEATDPFSYTAPQARWINHEWLTEYMFGWLWKHFGSPGLWMWRNAMALCVFGVAAWQLARAKASLGASALVFTFTALCLSAFFVFIRPQLATLALFAFVLAILRWHWDGLLGMRGTAHGTEVPYYERRGAALCQRHAIWCIPVLMAAWVNLHGGFLAGLGLLAIFSAAEMVRAWQDRAHIGPAVQILAVTALSVLATLVNPYRFELHRMLWEHLVPEQAVREWMPLWAARQAPLYYLPFVLVVLALVGSRRWKAIDAIVLAVVSWQAASHIRHIGLLAVATMVLLPGPLTESLNRLFPVLSRRMCAPGYRTRRWAAASALVLALAAMQAPFSHALVQQGLKPWEIATESSRDVPGVPVAALTSMVNYRIQGNVLTDYGWGQYVLWHLHPGCRVAFDGRYRTVYPAGLEQDFLAFCQLDAGGPSRTPMLDKHDTQIVLLPARRTTRHYMDRRPDFVKLYEDAQSVLYVRDRPEFAELVRRCRHEQLAALQVPAWSAFPAGPRHVQSAIVRPASEVAMPPLSNGDDPPRNSTLRQPLASN